MNLAKFLYLILSFTWGLPMTLVGCVSAAILMSIGFEPKRFLHGWYFEATNNSGFSMGPIAIVSKNPSQYLLKHEFGHSIQNCFFGPFMIFVVIIPSVVRFWYRKYLVNTKKISRNELPSYDSIWFEGTATRLGEMYFKYIGG